MISAKQQVGQLDRSIAQNAEKETEKISNMSRDGQKQEKKSAVLEIDQKKLTIKINSSPIQYQQQVLTQAGLQISLPNSDKLNSKNQADADRKFKYKYTIKSQDIMQFQSRYNQYQYCSQLAAALNRAINTPYSISIHKDAKASSCQTKWDNDSANKFNLEICSYLFNKIPAKVRCFENVFKTISLSKIKILFQNDQFFMEVVRFVILLVFKVKVLELIKIQLSTDSSNIQLKQSRSCNNRQQERKSSVHPDNYGEAAKQKGVKTTKYQKKVIKIYQEIRKDINQKCSRQYFERINILIGLFTRQNRLSNYLYQLNRQIIIDQLTCNLGHLFTDKLYGMDQWDKTIEYSGSKDAKIERIDITDTQPGGSTVKINQKSVTLQGLIKIIRTVSATTSRTQICYKIVDNYILKSQRFRAWLVGNIRANSLQTDLQFTNKLICLFGLICECSPVFMHGFYSQHYYHIDQVLDNYTRWIYITLYSCLPDRYGQQEQKLKMQAETSLNILLQICKATVKQTNCAINIGRAICKSLCSYAVDLRPSDIHTLTYVCAVNQYSRAYVTKYLFNFFTKCLSSIKKSLDIRIPKNRSINIIKKHKHKLIQIMQSLCNLNKIKSIELQISEHFLADLQSIVTLYISRFNGNSAHGGRYGTSNCLISSYQILVKSIRTRAQARTQQIGYY